MMEREILYTVAHDWYGEIVTASEAVKGNKFICPECSGIMILRKSGKTGPGTKRPHFAHKSLTTHCTAESVLHYGFKVLLAKKLREKISDRVPLNFEWECTECDETHKGDLLKKVSSVNVEHDLNIARPDIALLNKYGKPHAVIEIVVKHKPETKVVEFYRDNEIILIQINVTSDSDIDNIENKIKRPDLVTTCFHPRCPKCGHHLYKQRLIIVDAQCWKCDKPMKMAYVNAVHNRTQVSGFKPDWIKMATDNGVLIQKRYSKITRETYLVNICKSCDTFIGDHYLFTNYCFPAENGNLKSKSFEIGFECVHCEEAATYDGSEDDFKKI